MGGVPEPFIPLRKNDLVEALCRDGCVAVDEQPSFRTLCRLIGAIYHVEFSGILDGLKNAYAPFDPDADTKLIIADPAAQKQQKLNDLFAEFSSLMARADFRHLSSDDMELGLHARSHWGLDMDVDFRVFERLAIFARGDTHERRSRRHRGKPWREVEVDVPIYQRLVMILKLRQHPRVGEEIDTEKVYLQVFKNIPKLDIRMLLPGARVRINPVDRGKIGLSLLSGLAVTLWRVVGTAISSIIDILWVHINPIALWGLVFGAFSYGAKSFFDYQRTKERYNLSLTTILYFQNLDTNAGVLYRLVDEAEEQESRETILAYYLLWNAGGAQGCTPEQLDALVRAEVERTAGVAVTFVVRDTLDKLMRLNLVEKVGTGYRARPLPVAIETLGWTWAGFCKYNSPPTRPSPAGEPRPARASTIP